MVGEDAVYLESCIEQRGKEKLCRMGHQMELLFKLKRETERTIARSSSIHMVCVCAIENDAIRRERVGDGNGELDNYEISRKVRT